MVTIPMCGGESALTYSKFLTSFTRQRISNKQIRHGCGGFVYLVR
jgi:hypothetical protein